MRWLATVAAIALVACGSEPAAREPVVPSGPAGFEPHMARLDELVARGCACKSRGCIGAIDRDLAALVADVELVGSDPGLLESAVPARVESMKKLAVCMTDHEVASIEYGKTLLAKTEKLRDLACACPDRACARSLSVALAPEAGSVEWFPVEYDVLVKILAANEKLDSCAVPSPAVERAIRELGALRDDACACKDAACADQVQARFDVFLEAHRDTAGSDEEAARIGGLASAMSECLAAVRGELAP